VRQLSVVLAFTAAACGGGGEPTAPAPDPEQRKDLDLYTVIARGVTGKPAAGKATLQAGQAVSYNFSSDIGYTDLKVLLDGQAVAPSGSFRMDTSHSLLASADRITALGSTDNFRIGEARQILTAPDPVSAFASSVNRSLSLLEQIGPDSAGRLAGAVSAQAFDPVSDSAALRRVALALDNHAFVVDDSIPNSLVVPRSLAIVASSKDLRSYLRPVARRRDLKQGVSPTARGGANASPVPLSVIFVNGVGKSYEEAKDQFAQIIRTTRDAQLPGNHRVILDYNASEMYRPGSTGRCLVSLASLFLNSGPLAWVKVGLKCTTLGDFVRAGEQMLDVLGYVPALENSDAIGLAGLIGTEQAQGRAVIVLGHSQGTIIAQQAVELLAGNAATANLASTCLGVISVAAPLKYEGTSIMKYRGVAVAGSTSQDIILDLKRNEGAGSDKRIATQFTDFADTYENSLLAPLASTTAREIYPALSLAAFAAYTHVVTDLNLHALTESYLSSDAGKRWIVGTIDTVAMGLRTTCVPPTTGGNPSNLATIAPNFHSCAIGSSNQLYCWGNPGALGTGSSGGSNVPLQVTGGLQFKTVVTGQTHSCGISTDGRTFCWGSNGLYELGQSQTSASVVPLQVPLPAGVQLESLSAGDSHTCGLTAQGSAYCWGFNRYGQVGTGTQAPNGVIVSAVATNLRFVQLSAGAIHTCGLISDGTVYCWGDNELLQLGTQAVPQSCTSGDRNFQCSLVPIAVQTSQRFSALSSGEAHTCGLTAAGSAYCWGSTPTNTGGENYGLGDGRATNSPVPIPVAQGYQFVRIASGRGSTCGVTTTGQAYCWGANEFGQLGDGSTTSRLSPVASAGANRFAEIATGSFLTCGRLLLVNTILCWGAGPIGDGSTTSINPQPKPISIP
jgi:alpha-tubulin suppressor-like RCC1 family protein